MHLYPSDLEIPQPESGTLRSARRLFRLALAAAATFALLVGAEAFRISMLWGVVTLAGAATFAVLLALALRLWLDAILTVLRISALASEIADQAAVIAVNTTPVHVETGTER